jgi:predicted RNase H-like nuclease (RuvC/YqgF family)
MLLKTKLNHVIGTILILPIIGETEIPENGIIELEDEVANLLLDGDNWEEVVEEEIKEELEEEEEEDDVEEEELEEEEEEDGEDGVGDEKSEDNDSLNDKIDKLGLEDLINLAKESNLKGYNLFMKDVEKMRAFLKKKLEEAK